MFEGFLRRWPFIGIVLQAKSYELDCYFRNSVLLWRFLRKGRLEGLQNQSFIVYLCLRNPIRKWFLSVEQLEEDNSQGPHVDLGVDERSEVVEGLRRKVPISARALGSQLHSRLLALKHHFAKPEVQDLDNSVREHDVAGLEVVVDDLGFELEEVVECCK